MKTQIKIFMNPTKERGSLLPMGGGLQGSCNSLYIKTTFQEWDLLSKMEFKHAEAMLPVLDSVDTSKASMSLVLQVFATENGLYDSFQEPKNFSRHVKEYRVRLETLRKKFPNILE